MKVIILNQALEIFELGIKVETERGKLSQCVSRYGISSEIVHEQSKKLDKLINAFNELERRHIKDMEEYIQRRVAK